MKIATWNINGVKARLDNLLAWLKEAEPDVACLQELKSQDATFPRAAIEDLGYHVETHGQKSFNGVALVSKMSPEEITRGLPVLADGTGTDDEQARYIEGLYALPSSDADQAAQSGDAPARCNLVRVASIYLPNGNPVATEKYPYKLAWMERLHAHAGHLLSDEIPTVLAGDYNVIPEPQDAMFPENWGDDALYQPQTRQAFQRLTHLGYTDALRACHPRGHDFTFWDYQAGAWQKNNGIRIDHLLLSPEATDALRAVRIDKHTRGWEKPSDHVPVMIELG